MTKKIYSLTDEHRAQLKPWADKWIANAMSTAPMTAADRLEAADAMRALYRAADLAPPDREVFCSSPIGGAIAATVAAGVWWCRENPGEQRKLFGAVLTEPELELALREACRLAVAHGMARVTGDPVVMPRLKVDATRAATYAATDAATSDATDAATDAATRDATADATYAATYAARAATDATADATFAATAAATDAEIKEHVTRAVALLLRCCSRWYQFYQGGSHWSGWVAYLSFFRHVAKLDLPEYAKFDAYERLAEFGPRFVHRRFWILSDRPTVLAVDERDRPHRTDGPFCRWSDGWALHQIHGVQVPARVIRREFGVSDIDAERNAEVRRVMIDLYNAGDSGRYLRDAGAKVMHEDLDELGLTRRLLRREVSGDEPIVAVELQNSTLEPDGTRKTYTLRVPPKMRTCREAVAWTFDVPAKDYSPAVQT